MRRIIPKNAILIPPAAKKVFHGAIFDVYQWPQRLFDGSVATFEMLKRPDTVIIIAVKDGKIVVQDEEQSGIGRSRNFPGGRNDREDEDELTAARRELREETGLTFAKWKLLDVKQPESKLDWLVYVFLATDFVEQSDQQLDAGEKISVKLMDFAEVKELAETDHEFRRSANIFRHAGNLDELLNLPEYGA